MTPVIEYFLHRLDEGLPINEAYASALDWAVMNNVALLDAANTLLAVSNLDS